jgi:hypothetical protein
MSGNTINMLYKLEKYLRYIIDNPSILLSANEDDQDLLFELSYIVKIVFAKGEYYLCGIFESNSLTKSIDSIFIIRTLYILTILYQQQCFLECIQTISEYIMRLLIKELDIPERYIAQIEQCVDDALGDVIYYTIRLIEEDPDSRISIMHKHFTEFVSAILNNIQELIPKDQLNRGILEFLRSDIRWIAHLFCTLISTILDSKSVSSYISKKLYIAFLVIEELCIYYKNLGYIWEFNNLISSPSEYSYDHRELVSLFERRDKYQLIVAKFERSNGIKNVAKIADMVSPTDDLEVSGEIVQSNGYYVLKYEGSFYDTENGKVQLERNAIFRKLVINAEGTPYNAIKYCYLKLQSINEKKENIDPELTWYHLLLSLLEIRYGFRKKHRNINLVPGSILANFAELLINILKYYDYCELDNVFLTPHGANLFQFLSDGFHPDIDLRHNYLLAETNLYNPNIESHMKALIVMSTNELRKKSELLSSSQVIASIGQSPFVEYVLSQFVKWDGHTLLRCAQIVNLAKCGQLYKFFQNSISVMEFNLLENALSDRHSECVSRKHAYTLFSILELYIKNDYDNYTLFDYIYRIFAAVICSDVNSPWPNSTTPESQGKNIILRYLYTKMSKNNNNMWPSDNFNFTNFLSGNNVIRAVKNA